MVRSGVVRSRLAVVVRGVAGALVHGTATVVLVLVLVLVGAGSACEKDPLARAESAVDVTIEGLGHVTQEEPETDACAEGTCRFTHEAGTVVTYVAVSEAAWEFAGWSGARCADEPLEARCTFQVELATAFTATFEPVHPDIVNLNVNVTGPGRVTSTPVGIDCPGTCTFPFPWETEVALAAVPDDGAAFGGWDLACTGVDACAITMTQETVAAASFE